MLRQIACKSGGTVEPESCPADRWLQAHPRRIMTDESLLEQLTTLGLSRYEAAAYVGLLGRQSFSAPQLATRTGIPRQRIYDVLQSLAAKGLAHERVGTRRTFVAIPPDQALPTLLAERRAAAERELNEAHLLTTTLIAATQPLYTAGSDEDNPLDYIDVLLDPRQIGARARALAQEAEHEILVCFKRPLVSSFAENISEVREPLARGVRYRALYESSARDDADLQPMLAAFRELGQQMRFVPSLPIKMNLFDERAALLSLQDPLTGRPSITALCLTHPSLALTLKKAFDAFWAEGTP